MPTYPSTLPRQQLKDYTYRKRNGYISFPMEQGRSKRQRVASSVRIEGTFTLILSESQYTIFRSWYPNTVRHGEQWIDTELVFGKGTEFVDIRFIDGYNIRSVSHKDVELRSNIQIRRIPTLTATELEAIPNINSLIPGVLNKYKIEGHSTTSMETLIEDDGEYGFKNVRRRFADQNLSLTLSWTFSQEDFRIFEAYYENTLHGGISWFDLRQHYNSSTRSVRFTNGYRAKLIYHHSDILHNLWDVTADVETRHDRQ